MIAAVVCVVLSAFSGHVRADRTSFLEVFSKSNDFECVELNFDGVAVHVKVRFGGLTFYVSPVISHYNPDFLVTAYQRLGNSPLLESYAAFGTAQNVVSEPVVELLSGADAPATYATKDEWGGGKGTDSSKNQNKTLAYYEAEVFGHPGNIFTWASQAFRGENPIDPAIAQNFITAIPRQAGQIPNRIDAAFNEVQANASTTLGNGFSVDALSRVDPVALATNFFLADVADLYASSGIGAAIDNVRDVIPDSVEEDIVGTLIDYGGESLTTLSSDAAVAGGGAGVPVTGGGEQGGLPRFDLAGLGDDVVNEVRDQIGGLSPEAVRARVSEDIAGIQAQVAEVQEMFETLQALADPALLADLVPGVSATVMPFDGMCPSDAQPFFPYYLSGTNILSWRYKIPEIVYPQTYIPFSNATTIGTLFPGGSTNRLASNPLSALAEIQNYGSVYPRNGYLLQSHPLKAAAVAAFRATHVVTRPNQPHIYSHPRPRERGDILKLEPGYDEFSSDADNRSAPTTYLEPDVEESGRWQLVHNPGGEKDQQCRRFGAPDDNPKITRGHPVKMIGGIANTFTDQWADDKASDDNSYIFSLWRRYRCAPRPTGSGGLFGSRVWHLFNVELPSPIAILH